LLGKPNDELAEGVAAVSNSDLVAAVEHFTKAWQFAVWA
jgi:hypothetical protein